MTNKEAMQRYKEWMDARLDGKWEEGKHPRAENGQFSSSRSTKPKDMEVSRDTVEKKLAKCAKTEAAISKALSGLGFKNTSKDHGVPNFEKQTPEGMLRVYVAGSGRNKEIKVQDWKSYTRPKASVTQMNEAQQKIDKVKAKYQNPEQPEVDFKDMPDEDKYATVLYCTYMWKRNRIGLPKAEAFADAISNADYWKSEGYEGYKLTKDW